MAMSAPPGTIQGKGAWFKTNIYKQLTAIREFRNRIAHHEPICFNATRAIDTKYAKEHYELIRTYIEYM